MCGRFTLTKPIPWLAEIMDLDNPEQVGNALPRYNVSPGTDIAIVRSRENKPRELALARWGLVPFWAKDPDFGAKTINARSETAARKPAFRAAFRYRRCLIPADGFYEWAGSGRKKQPWFIHLENGKPFAFAGLWESWTGADGSVLETCTILTTEANEKLGRTASPDARHPAGGVLCGLAEPGREPREGSPAAAQAIPFRRLFVLCGERAGEQPEKRRRGVYRKIRGARETPGTTGVAVRGLRVVRRTTMEIFRGQARRQHTPTSDGP